MPVSFDTWTELQAAIEAWTDIDVSDAQVQEFIGLAEAHFQRTVFTPDREAAYSLSADAGSEALPDDFWGFKSGPYVDGAPDVVLTRVTPGELRAMYPSGTTGTPSHYAIEGENILFGPVPASATDIKGTYYVTITPLSGSAASNWLLLAHPDLYLAGSLAEAFSFSMDEAREAKWVAKREAIIADINRSGARRAANSGPLVASTGLGNIPNIQA
jgi:hypothetical protein